MYAEGHNSTGGAAACCVGICYYIEIKSIQVVQDALE